MDTSNTETMNNGAANGNWDRKVEQAKTGAHSTIDRLSENARPAVDKLSASAHQAVDRLSDMACQAAASFSGKVGNPKDMQEQLLADAREQVREKPVAALAIAVAAGFILSRLFSSR